MEGDMEGDREEGLGARRRRGGQGKKWKELRSPLIPVIDGFTQLIIILLFRSISIVIHVYFYFFRLFIKLYF